MSDVQQRLQLNMSRYNCCHILQKQGISQLGQRQLLQGDVLTNSQDRRALASLLLLVGSGPQAPAKIKVNSVRHEVVNDSF